MKKRIIILLVCMMCFMMVGCSLSTKKQKEVVDQFLTSLKAADFTKLQSYCSDDNVDLGDFQSIINELESYQNVDTYGQTFVDEANQYIKNVFNELLESYEITDVTKENEQYVVNVKAQMKDFSDLSIDNSQYTKMVNTYQKEHLNELRELYKKQGEQAMMKKVYGDLSKEIFNDLNKKMKKMNSKNTDLKFVLEKSDGEYFITEIK